jgi:outer membrane protein assembly factor BamB
VIAVEVADGSIAWEASFASPVRSSPAVSGGLVFVNDEGGRLTALATSDGTQAWTVDEGVAAESMPLVMNGWLYVGTQRGDLLALDAATGSRRWAFSTGGELTHSPSSDGTRIFIGSGDGTLYALDARTGERAWTFAGQATRWTTAAVRDGTVLTVGHEIEGGGDALFAIDSASGRELWRAEEDEPLYAPSAAPGLALVADSSGTLRAYDPTTGTVRWTAEIGGYARPAAAIVGSMAYLFGGDNEAVGVDLADGGVSWRVPLDGTVEYGTTAAGRRLFAVTTAGTLFGLGPADLAVASPKPSASPEASSAIVATPLGEPIEAPSGLTVPTGLDRDTDGNIWVAEGGRNGFAIFAADGTFLGRWGTPGSGDGEFDFDNANSGNPTADIVFTEAGDFYVADTGNFRIQHFDAERRLIGAWGGFGQENGQFAIPFALDLDADGNVYVTSGNGNIQVFTRDGAYLRTIGEPGSGDGQLANAGLAVSDDRLLVADWDNHRIVVFDLDGTFRENWAVGEIRDPNAIDVTEDGTVLVTAGNHVWVLDAAGAILGKFDVQGPAAGVAALGEGRVAVSAWRSDPPGSAEFLKIYEISRR